MNNIVDDIELSGIESEPTTETVHKAIERPISLSNARLKEESFEDYKTRRKQCKKWSKQSLFHKSIGEDNRATRRKKTRKTKLRLTKPLRKIRNKWMVGETNVTRAIKTGIPLHQYLRVAAMGLDVKKLTALGKEFTEEQKNGNNSDNIT